MPKIALDALEAKAAAALERAGASKAAAASTARALAYADSQGLSGHGTSRVAMYAAAKGGVRSFDAVQNGSAPWIAPDDAMPEHPSVLWRKRHFPKVKPAYRVNSILTVMECVALGLGVGLLPVFLAAGRKVCAR